ncbi:glycosyltransferase [Aliarcobacter skirrowii]|uniref:glycosyltransferase n=1 Tax=Aliarcobacter skirrowii TaxID=28200 RepID=UPI00082E86ED|nr:glycosyltransferase [Aliarcobacter skirrowii]
MNILLTAFYTTELGGGETSFINVINYLSNTKKDFSITLVVPRKGVFPKYIDSGVHIIEVQNKWDLFKLSGDFDIAIHNYINYGKKFLFLPFLKAKKHSFICHGLWDIPRFTKLNLLKIKSAKLFCVNNELLNQIDYDDKNLLNLGVNLKNYNIQKNSREFINIGVIGRFQDIKNQLFALDVFKELQIHHKNIKINFIGDEAFTEHSKNYKKKVINKAKDFTNVEFLGNKNTEEVFDNIDIVFVSSKYESFGMVVIEALSNGLICIAPDIGGPKQIMSDKLRGFLYISDDISSASKLLDRVLSDIQDTKKEFNSQQLYYKEKYDVKNTLKLLIGEDI